MYQSNFEFDSNQGEIKNLITRYEEMISSDSVSFFEREEYLQLIDYLEKQSRFKDALDLAETALVQHSYSFTFYLRKAQLYIELDMADEALVLLEQALLYDSSEIELQITKADALSLKGDYKNALSWLEEAESNASSTDIPELWLAKASVYEDQELYIEAFYMLKNIILKFPDYNEAIDRLSIMVELSEKHEDSIEIYKQIIDHAPYSADIWYNLASSYIQLEKIEAAAEAYQYSYIVDPSFEMAYYDSADMYLLLEQFNKAEAIYKEAEEQFGSNANINLHLGSCYEMMNKHDLAIRYLEEAIAQEPNMGEAFYRLGKCFAKQQIWQNALTAFNKALAIDEKNTDYIIAAGETYFQIGNKEKAILYFEKSIVLSPSDAALWIHYISALVHLEDNMEALKVVEDAKEHILSNDLEYIEFVCLYKVGYHKDALNLLQKCLIERYDNHNALLDLFPELRLEEPIMTVIQDFHV